MRLKSPFLLRTFSPPLSSAFGKKVRGVRRIGKRIVLELEGDLFLVIHLMIAGRFRWKPAGAPIPGKLGLAAFDFPNGTLLLTEASTKKRASLHVVAGEESLREFSRGGIEVSTPRSRVSRGAPPREPHRQARAHRSAALQRHRQLVFRRDPARRAISRRSSAPRSSTTTRSPGSSKPPDAPSTCGPIAFARRPANASRKR